MKERNPSTDHLIALVWSDASAEELQSRLVYLGYFDGRIDGEPCRQTFDALARFQRDRGLRVTGYPDPQTLRTLRASYTV